MGLYTIDEEAKGRRTRRIRIISTTTLLTCVKEETADS